MMHTDHGKHGEPIITEVGTHESRPVVRLILGDSTFTLEPSTSRKLIAVLHAALDEMDRSA